MGYKEKGAGGERLNAGDLNELINSYKLKAHASFSNKLTDLSDIDNNSVMFKCNSGTIHFLFENVERKSYYNDGSDMSSLLDWSSGNIVPDITSVTLKYLSGADCSYSLRNTSTNRKAPTLLKTKEYDDFYVEYWYSYVTLSVDVDASGPNRYYLLTGISYSETSIEETTLRISYGNINVINSPNAVQSRSLDLNFTNVLGYAFAENTNMIFYTTKGKSTPGTIRIDNMFTEQNIKSFKLAIVNDNSTDNGISVATTGEFDATAQLTHTITSIGSGGTVFLHEMEYVYSTLVNEYPDGLYSFEYHKVWLNFDPSYDFYSGVILLPNSTSEFGLGFPDKLGDIADGTPLTNILLSYMSSILNFTVYKYGIQNYTAIRLNSLDTGFFNSVIPSRHKNDGIENTWLTGAGAYYQLLDMLNFNDGQEISWNIQYIK